MNSLTLSQVTKAYDGATVLDAVGFTVAPGERVALLGHNGAGKSTLMKIILGLIPATSGQVEVLGGAPASRAARDGIHPSLTGLEQIRLYLRLRGGDPRQAIALLERVGWPTPRGAGSAPIPRGCASASASRRR